MMLNLLFFYFLLVYVNNGQACTGPVYSNSGVTIRGPCPSSQVIAPVGSIVLFECSFSYTGNYFTLWNITDIVPIVGVNSPNFSNITITINSVSGSNGYTTVTLPITKQDSVDVQCGLCNGIDCYSKPLKVTVISLPVQLISFGK